MPRKSVEEQSKYFKEWYSKNKEKVQQRSKQWKKDNLTPEKRKQYQDKWYKKTGALVENKYYHEERDKSKLRANWMVARSIKTGKIMTQPCMVCGDEKAEAHHDSYTKDNWLIVRWLCRKHHYEAEGRSASSPRD
ncbi:hypothetical protein LCGC14_1585970 [marine sediment metagenome]|uniref:Uncharacterized protein n=1 Tax=marine sediment metagenome TaxID=412755 RepID=A0A0F9IFN9_9ZZZZ